MREMEPSLRRRNREVSINVTEKNSKEDGDKSFCLSAECYQTTGEILSMKDPSVDPCTDFYDHACGKFVATHSVSLDHYEASVEQRASDSIRLHLKHWLESPPGKNDVSVLKKARDLYSSCMYYGSQENKSESIILGLIKEMSGGWPALDAAWESPSLSVEKVLSSLTSMGVAVTFQLDILPDSSNPNKYIIRISPGTPFLSQHEKHELLSDRVLRSYLVSALTLLGMYQGAASNSVENMLEVDFHFILIKEQADKECGQGNEIEGDRGTQRVRLTELDTLMQTEVKWTAVLEDVLGSVDKSAVSAVDVYCGHYIREYVQLLYGNMFNKRQIYNYLATRFFFTFISHLGPQFYGLHQNYYSQYVSSTVRPFKARWKECVFLLEKYLLPATATVYAQEVSAEVQKEAKRILVSMKSSFQNMLPSFSWIEENERERIKQKVSKVDFQIALTEYSHHVSELDKLFSGLQLDQNCLICNVLELQKFIVTSRLQKLVSPDQPDVEWKNMTLTSPNYYQHSEGFLKIHFDKVIPPFLRLHHPNSLNYGNFGFFLSRELVHYALSSGEMSQKLRNCLSDQYSRYKIEEVHMQVDGSRTLEENFVDNLSLLIAYKAYERYNEAGVDKKLPGLHLSDRQNFFLSFAQYGTHKIQSVRKDSFRRFFECTQTIICNTFLSYYGLIKAFCEVRDIGGYKAYVHSTFAPSKARVNIVLKNSKEFSEAYTCVVGSAMNPTGKCTI